QAGHRHWRSARPDPWQASRAGCSDSGHDAQAVQAGARSGAPMPWKVRRCRYTAIRRQEFRRKPRPARTVQRVDIADVMDGHGVGMRQPCKGSAFSEKALAKARIGCQSGGHDFQGDLALQ
nr:hypothetical protein [Tanacetum cinerariifolium]